MAPCGCEGIDCPERGGMHVRSSALVAGLLMSDRVFLPLQVAAASRGAGEHATFGHGDVPQALAQAEFPSQALSMGLDDAFAMEEF